jgi:hypothetical protein
MDFARYRVPASARDGVDIDLPGTTGATFRVRLPSHYNREYSAAAQRALSMKLTADGKPDLTTVDFLAWREARLAAFLEHCVIGFPDGLTRDDLADEYRPGLEALFERAEELANDEQVEAIETTKKSNA